MTIEEKGISGIIYPPPEVKTIVDKTAQFVARNGIEFEARIRLHEKDNPKFKFLLKENPYNAYYELKVDETKRKLAEAAATPAASEQPTETQAPEAQEGPAPGPQPVEQSQVVSSSQKPEVGPATIIRQVKQIPKENPCPTLYTVPVPTDVTPLDLDVIRLTAQYVARHGQSFLTNITAREQKNPQFDFLRGTHRLFQFFRALVDAYTRILMPSKELIDQLREEMENKLVLLDRCVAGAEWQKVQAAKQKAQEEEEDKQRVQFQLIDWHDFVVVETIDFKDDPDEPMDAPYPAPPPVAPKPTEIAPAPIAPPPRVPPPPPGLPEQVASSSQLPRAPPIPGGMMLDEEEEADVATSSNAVGVGANSRRFAGVMVEDDDAEDVPVIRDAVVEGRRRALEPQKVVDPHTGQLVDANQMSEHMRIKTLDPKWKEQQKREREKQSTTNIAPDMDMSGVLQSFASRRTDIFGDVEGELGQSVEALKKKQEKPSQAVDASKRAESGLPPPFPRPNIPGMPPPPPPAGMPPIPGMSNLPLPSGLQIRPGMPPPPTSAAPTPFAGGVMPPAFPPPPPPTSAPPVVSAAPAMMAPPAPPAVSLPSAPTFVLPPAPPVAVPTEAPPTKRQRTDAAPGPIGISFTVIIPQLATNEINCPAQTIPLSLPDNMTVASLKEMVQTRCGIPPAKFQLKMTQGSFLKDSQTLLQAGMSPDCTVELSLRQRGGKKN